jgi:hypothetical protein
MIPEAQGRKGPSQAYLRAYLLHQTTRLLRIQKWLPHRSFGTQIEGDKDARPLRNERFHLGIADGIRHTSIRSPQPQGQERIAHLYLLDFPTM